MVTTENDRYIQGQYYRLGKVLFCYEDKVLISGFDKKPHMVLADMAAMQRIRDRIAEEPTSSRSRNVSGLRRLNKAANERAVLAQAGNAGQPVSGSEEKVGLSQVIGNSSRLERDKMLMP